MHAIHVCAYLSESYVSFKNTGKICAIKKANTPYFLQSFNPFEYFNDIVPQLHDNEPWSAAWTSLGERRSFRGQRGLARPECAGLSSPPDMVAQDSSSLRHKAPLHILLYPIHCRGPASKAHGSSGCFGTKCISCHWRVPVPVQLLHALRCSARSTQANIRRGQDYYA